MNTEQTVSRILIVDDHAIVRRGFSELVSNEPGLEVCGEADSAELAMQVIEEHEPDLVIVDITLKDSNGLDLIKRIRARNEQTIILVVSMFEESLYGERVLDAGAKGYVSKQEATDNVIDAIHRILDDHFYVSDELKKRYFDNPTGSGKNTSRSSIERLTNRELQVYELLGHGNSARKIAAQLGLSVKTIETHREHIKDKVKVKNSTELNKHAIAWVLQGGKPEQSGQQTQTKDQDEDGAG